jgi:hypothetical protein
LQNDDLVDGKYRNFAKNLIEQPLVVNLDPQLAKYRNFKQMHHFLILEPQLEANQSNNDAQIMDLHTYNVWFNESIHLRCGSTLFPDKWHNFNGGYVVVASTPDSNQANLDEYIKTKQIKNGGYSAGGAVEILQYFNTTPRFNTNTPIFGYKNAQGKWIGMIGEVLDNNACLY